MRVLKSTDSAEDKTGLYRPGRMAQWLRTLGVSAEDSGLVSSTSMAPYNCLIPIPGEDAIFRPLWALRVHGTQTCIVGETPIHINFFFLFKKHILAGQ